MGMPISNFTVFKTLADKKLDSIELQLARDCFKDFNLLTFIIYDPDKHTELFNKLSNSFNVLDKKTGEKLLFFAVCNAPDNWDEKVAQRSYSDVYNWSKEQFEKHNLSNTNLHNSDAAYAIARAFKINSNDLPCIIVTNDFEKREFCWFKTCHEHIELQLLNLSYIAEEYPYLKSNWKDAKRIMTNKQHNVDLCDDFGSARLTESMAQTLSTILAFLESVCSRDKDIRSMAKQDVSNILRSLQLQLEDTKINLQEKNKAYSRKFERLNIEIASLITILDTQPLTIPKYISQNEKYIEKESYNNLYLGMKILDIFSDSKRLKYLIGNDDINLVDYTPTIICITKAFEREIGLSLGHTVRKYLGIKLPKYYNKYDRELEKGKSCILPHVSLVTKPRAIGFNDGKLDRWIAPGIGQMLLAIKTLHLEDYIELDYFIKQIKEFEHFLNIWKSIEIKRNACAHTERITRSEALQVKEYIKDLSNNNIFYYLSDLKLRYKS